MCLGYAFKAKIFDYVILLLIIFISGFRYEVGYDYYNYYSMFVGNHLELEPLFMVVISLFRAWWDEPQYVFFFFSAVTISIIFYAIKKFTKYYRTSFLIYLLIPGLYLNSFSIIRQGIAISFFFLSIYYLLYLNKRSKYLIISMIGFMFHFSAIIPIVIVLLMRRLLAQKYSLYFHIIIMTLALLIGISGIMGLVISTIGGRYSVYSTAFVEQVSVFKIIVLFFFSLFILYSYEKNSDKNLTFLLNLYQLGIIVNFVFSDFTAVTRLSYYFLIFQTILVPRVIYTYRHQAIKLLMLTLFIVYYFGIQINALLVDEKLDSYPKMTPYKNYFSDN